MNGRRPKDWMNGFSEKKFYQKIFLAADATDILWLRSKHETKKADRKYFRNFFAIKLLFLEFKMINLL